MNTGQKSGWVGLVVEARWPNEVHRTKRGRPRQGGAEAIQVAIEAVRVAGGGSRSALLLGRCGRPERVRRTLKSGLRFATRINAPKIL